MTLKPITRGAEIPGLRLVRDGHTRCHRHAGLYDSRPLYENDVRLGAPTVCDRCASRCADAIARNVGRMLSDRIDHDTFHARQRRLWRAAESHGVQDAVAAVLRDRAS